MLARVIQYSRLGSGSPTGVISPARYIHYYICVFSSLALSMSEENIRGGEARESVSCDCIVEEGGIMNNGSCPLFFQALA
jgi:hypothetical protein